MAGHSWGFVRRSSEWFSSSLLISPPTRLNRATLSISKRLTVTSAAVQKIRGTPTTLLIRETIMICIRGALNHGLSLLHIPGWSPWRKIDAISRLVRQSFTFPILLLDPYFVLHCRLNQPSLVRFHGNSPSTHLLPQCFEHLSTLNPRTSLARVSTPKIQAFSTSTPTKKAWNTPAATESTVTSSTRRC